MTYATDLRRGQSVPVSLPTPMRDEMAAEAERQDRSLSWLVQKAWSIARDTIAKFPSAPEARP